MSDFLILVHELLCAALLYTVFCRSVRSDDSVRVDVRLSFFVLGLVACIGLACPVTWDFQPNAFTLLLLLAIVVVQIATSRHWHHGVPYSFYKPGLRPMRRSSDRGVPNG